MKKVIVGTPRSGTTCGYDHLLRNKGCIDIDTLAYSKQHAIARNHPIGDRSASVAVGEWLSGDVYTLKEVEDNILFLAEERTYGREYSLKILYPQLRDYLNWFYDFYTPDEVYIIRRRDIWKQYKSTMYQISVAWGNSTWVGEDVLQFKPLFWPASEYIPETRLFFQNVKDIYEFNYGEVLYYEDHDWGNKTTVLSKHIDYEKHFINFEEIKNHFDAQYSMYKQTV